MHSNSKEFQFQDFIGLELIDLMKSKNCYELKIHTTKYKQFLCCAPNTQSRVLDFQSYFCKNLESSKKIRAFVMTRFQDYLKSTNVPSYKPEHKDPMLNYGHDLEPWQKKIVAIINPTSGTGKSKQFFTEMSYNIF